MHILAEVSFTESYHGSTYGSISISALSLNMRRKIGPLLPDVFHINYPDMLRGKYGKDEDKAIESYLDELRYAFDHYLPPEEVAAVFIEPIAGEFYLLLMKFNKAFVEPENGFLMNILTLSQT